MSEWAIINGRIVSDNYRKIIKIQKEQSKWFKGSEGAAEFHNEQNYGEITIEGYLRDIRDEEILQFIGDLNTLCETHNAEGEITIENSYSITHARYYIEESEISPFISFTKREKTADEITLFNQKSCIQCKSCNKKLLLDIEPTLEFVCRKCSEQRRKLIMKNNSTKGKINYKPQGGTNNDN